MTETLNLLDTGQKVSDLFNRSVHEGPDQCPDLSIKVIGNQDPQFRLFTVSEMDRHIS